MSIRSRARYHAQWKRHWLTILSLTVCPLVGHRWGLITTDLLGSCDRCFRPFEPALKETI